MKVLPLPKSFDANEWLIFVCLIVSYAIVIPLRRKIPAPIFVLVFIYSITMAKLFDATLGVPPFDMYDINDWPNLISWIFYFTSFTLLLPFCSYTYTADDVFKEFIC